MAPEGKIGDETFRVIRDAMAETKTVGIGRVVLTAREHPVLVEPKDAGMMMFTLRAPEEVRSATAYFENIGTAKLNPEMIDLARKIIAQKTGPFDPEELNGDRYQAALRDLVARKVSGVKPASPKIAATAGNVVNLMDALRRSVAPNAAARPERGRGGKSREQTETAIPAHSARKPSGKTRRAS